LIDWAAPVTGLVASSVCQPYILSDPPCVGRTSTSKSTIPVPSEDPFRREEREVREMLVIDRVELVLSVKISSAATYSSG
jgi:hypothetical protein